MNYIADATNEIDDIITTLIYSIYSSPESSVTSKIDVTSNSREIVCDDALTWLKNLEPCKH